MLKWTLFVMLFVTQPYSLPNGTPKDESKHFWTLQSSSSMEFQSRDGCMQSGYRIYQSIKPVANLAFRGLCLCESTDNEKKCPPVEGSKSLPTSKSFTGENPVSFGSDAIPMD